MKKEKSITIFIVDDNKIISLALESMLKESLEEYNVAIYKFESGETCLGSLDELQPNIVILDFHLNSSLIAMNGINVLKRIKMLSSTIEVVMLSGEDKLDIAVESIKYGAHDYVIKNESAFIRMKQIIKNIADKIHLKTNLKKYTIWNWVFFSIVLLIVVGEIIYLSVFKYLSPK